MGEKIASTRIFNLKKSFEKHIPTIDEIFIELENRMPLHIKDVGIIYDTSVHDIDTANWLFSDMPQVVSHEREKSNMNMKILQALC